MPQSVVLTGSDELNRKLARLKSKDAKKAIRKASRAALRPVLEAVKAKAPKRSGKLRRSLKIRALPRSRSRVGARVTTGGKARQFAGETFYGGFQEYGWKSGNRKNPGKRFMKQSASAKKQRALSIYASETRRWVNELSS